MKLEGDWRLFLRHPRGVMEVLAREVEISDGVIRFTVDGNPVISNGEYLLTSAAWHVPAERGKS